MDLNVFLVLVRVFVNEGKNFCCSKVIMSGVKFFWDSPLERGEDGLCGY